jgi:hypothetical protein
MKEIKVSRNLLETIAYDYDELNNPMENLSDYDYIKDETKDCIYYMEYEDDMRFYALENIKSAYEKTETIFDVISTLETANEIENYLYSAFGESRKVNNIFNYYMEGKDQYAKRKTFWMVLDSMED